MLPYGLLTLLQSPRKIALGLWVGGDAIGRDRVHVQEMGEIIFITGLHRIELFLKTGDAVEVNVVAGGKGMIKAIGARVFLCRTRRKRQHEEQSDSHVLKKKPKIENAARFHLNTITANRPFYCFDKPFIAV